MPFEKNSTQKWENKHRTFTENVLDIYTLKNSFAENIAAYNEMTNDVMQLITEAIAKQQTLRALGAGWSWHQIMTGGSSGTMLDTKQLNMLFDIEAADLDAAYTGDSKYLKFAQCGRGIWELNRKLKQKNLSLKTTGASNGQTIAGLIGTGAHGSAIDVGAAQDFVLGLHIICGANKHVYLERASRPVLNDAFAQKFNTQIVRDDELFNAALVSFGCFGFIHGVLVEVEDIFLINASMRKQVFDDEMRSLMKSLDFSNAICPGLARPKTRPYHFEVKLNPYDTDKQVFVTSMYKEAYHDAYTPPVANAEGIGPGDDAPAFIGKVTNGFKFLVPKLINTLTESSLTLYENATGTIGEIFNNTALRGKLLSAAIGIQPADVLRVIDILLEENEDKKHGTFAGIFAFRFIKKSEATLAFTRFDTTCVLEMDGTFSKRSIAYCNAIWDRLQAENIAFTCHWGKQTNLNAARIHYMYGKPAVDSWKKARNILLDADSKKVFTNPIMVQWGLD